MKSLAGCHSGSPLSRKEPGAWVAGGGGAVSHEDSLGHKRKGLQECLGDQLPAVMY